MSFNDKAQALRIVRPTLTERELFFGDYSDGRWIWHLTEPFALPEPIPCRGHQQFWPLPEDVEARVMAQLPAHVR